MARRLLLLAAVAGLTLAGCSLLISGKDTGRPCLNGQCPTGFVCQNDACIRSSAPPPDAGTDGGTDGGLLCTGPSDCPACAAGVQVCGADGTCGCATLHGSFSSIAPDQQPSGFVIGGAQLGEVTCGTKDIYQLCGGFSQ